jgi:hypothetical protein
MIHVLTRTNNRPNKFKLCAESVAMQTIECRHTTISEDQYPPYVLGYNNIDSIVLPKNEFEHYNQYLDWAMQDGGQSGDYFACLDDDDFYLWPDSLEIAMNEGQGADLIIWRVNASNNVIVPRDMSKQQVTFGDISGIGFLVKKGSFKNAKFGNKLGGDYNFLKDAVKECKSVKWINKVLSSTNPLDTYGAGLEKDMAYETAKKGYHIAQNQLKLFR